MAQHGRNGNHNEDRGAETASYIFNPMSYDYHQNQVFSAPTVLSQQDATVMADFFNNNPNGSSNDYPGYAVEAKNDFAAGSMAHSNVLSDSAISNSLGDHSHVNFNNHLPQQPTSNQIFAFDFGNIYPPGHQQTSSHTARDAVAGASALLGLSTSQEQANLLNANNYMTWQNIVGAQLQPPSNTTSANANITSHNTPGLHKGSNPQIHSQNQSPQLQQPLTSWAEVSAQAMQQRARHPSLQLDTSNTMPSHTHQQAWQNAPQSALPHVGPRRPAPVPRFGSDNAFSPHGYGSSSAPPGEDKHGMTTDSAMESASTPVQQRRQAHPQLMRHHSMSAAVPAQLPQHSPVMGGQQQLMHSPYGQHQHMNNMGVAPGSARKRNFSAIDEGVTQNTVGRAPPVPDVKQLAKNHEAAHAQSADSDGAATAPAAGGRRRAQREPKPPRQNLTDAQKRQNHIASEQKRRDTMKTNFDLLSKRVPIIRDSGAMSRSEILYHVANHIESAKTGNSIMCRVAGITLEQLDAMSDSEDDDDADGESNE